jgi:hypothetical protein
MKILTCIALALLPVLAFGSQEITIAPMDRIRISAFSDRMLVIETSKVEWRPAKEEGGIEVRELVISGNVVEALRGKSPGKVFTHTCQDVRVSNEDAYKKSHGGASSPDLLHFSSKSAQTGAAELKVGLRYLAIYFLDSVFFVQVTANDETWRSKILELQPEAKNWNEPSKPAQTDGDKSSK